MTGTIIAQGFLGLGPEAAAQKRTFEDIGFVCVETQATRSAASKLAAEAQACLGQLRRAVRDDTRLRYSAGIADLGPKAVGFLNMPALTDDLRSLTGQEVRLNPDMSCLTVYEAGDQLGVHLDQPADRCAVTVIFYLCCTSPAPDAANSGLQLRVYGRDRQSTMGEPRQIIRTRPGRLVFGLGSKVWHERPRLQPGERVIALTSCFEFS